MSRTTVTVRRRNADAPTQHETEEDRRTRGELWFAAVKPPMYTVAVMPVLIGSFAAYAEFGRLNWSVMLGFLGSAICVIAWLNLTNDVFDFDTGIDVNKKESVVNLCGATRRARNWVLMLAMAFLAVAARMFYAFGDEVVWVLMGTAVLGGYMYQGPPFRLGYFGLGEPICFLGWSLTVAAAFYAQVGKEWEGGVVDKLGRVLQMLSGSYLGGAVLLEAIPTTWILFCSHFHQVKDDLEAGKKSPVIRLGTRRAVAVLDAWVISFWLLEVVLRALQVLPGYVFYLSLLATPYSANLVKFVKENHSVPEAVRPAKYYAVKFHMVHGSLVALGYLLTGNRAYSS